MRHASTIAAVLAALLLISCGKHSNDTPTPLSADTVALRYSRLLTIVRHAEGCATVTIRDPWRKGATLRSYTLVPRDKPLPPGLPETELVRTPLQRAVAFSSVHAALCEELGVLHQLVGVCDADYIVSPTLRRALAEHRLADMGQAMQPLTEKIAASGCDALLVSPFQNNTYGAIEQLGLPIIECADYMESHPLARAEWMRFYGMLFGCEHEVDSLFASIEQEYLRVKADASSSKHPKLLVDMKTGPIWYVAGGRSTMGQLYADAGARYAFAHLKEAGSVSLSFESVYKQAADADLWLIKYGSNIPLSYALLAADEPRYSAFGAFKKRRVYACNTLHTPVFEETAFHPELMLRDIARLCSGSDADLRYFKPLAEQ